LLYTVEGAVTKKKLKIEIAGLKTCYFFCGKCLTLKGFGYL